MASRGAIAARFATARQRLIGAVERIAKDKGVTIPPAAQFPIRQPELKAAVELERLADALEAISPVPTVGQPVLAEQPVAPVNDEPPRRGPGRPRKSTE